MLKLISGALVGGTNYSEIYNTCGIEKDDMQPEATTVQITLIKRAAMNSTEKFQHCRKLQEKVARLEKMELDEKQYIAYEMVACTFLLGLLKDEKDSNTTFFNSLQKNDGRRIITRNSRHCEKIGGERWSRAITSVSYGACWIRIK
jgi:hypothetical protein